MNGTEDGHYYILEVISRLLTLNPKPSTPNPQASIPYWRYEQSVSRLGSTVWGLESRSNLGLGLVGSMQGCGLGFRA